MSDELAGDILAMIFLGLAGISWVAVAVLRDLDKPRTETIVTSIFFFLMGIWMLAT